MFQLKPLSRERIPLALEKAERYSLLNEPRESESICLDILEVDPTNQQALVTLLLAITDQFSSGWSSQIKNVGNILPRLTSEYERHYYAGIICERQAKAILGQSAPGYRSHAYHWFREAMEKYEMAETLSPPDNDDAVIRWNSCARIIMKEDLEAGTEVHTEQFLE